ncbi:MAG: CBS domain-containing protein [Fimbriimonadaceae bacterium]|nr:CBS domain-containing protein [Fimbriimonadaceae bacterium]QYK57097.1 MAG: CBS domain-containing protein [Fimbriimonadaceae bacterium]
MQLNNVISKNVFSVDPETQLGQAAQIMRNEGIGMLPVVDRDNQPVGVLTDRDITVRAFAAGIPPTAPVSRAMTSPARTICDDCEVDEALAMMGEAQIGRLVVCDEKGTLSGVISLGDALDHCSADKGAEVGRTLAHRNRNGNGAG